MLVAGYPVQPIPSVLRDLRCRAHSLPAPNFVPMSPAEDAPTPSAWTV
ncbi:MAG: hypothetical protein O3C36_00100 [archaeon]|nr:hypothetical protein [archaeon]